MKSNRIVCLLALLAMTAGPALAQGYGHYGQQEQVIMYNLPGNSRAPSATVVERGLAPTGIPTSGVQPIQLENRTETRGPTVMYQTDHGRMTVISGPNGKSYCRRGYGASMVCY